MKKSIKVRVVLDTSDNVYKVYRSNLFLHILGLDWVESSYKSMDEALKDARKKLFGNKHLMGEFEITEDGHKEI